MDQLPVLGFCMGTTSSDQAAPANSSTSRNDKLTFPVYEYTGILFACPLVFAWCDQAFRCHFIVM